MWSWIHLFPMHPFYNSWKNKKTLRFSDVFKGSRNGALETNELMNLVYNIIEVWYVAPSWSISVTTIYKYFHLILTIKQILMSVSFLTTEKQPIFLIKNLTIATFQQSISKQIFSSKFDASSEGFNTNNEKLLIRYGSRGKHQERWLRSFLSLGSIEMNSENFLQFYFKVVWAIH